MPSVKCFFPQLIPSLWLKRKYLSLSIDIHTVIVCCYIMDIPNLFRPDYISCCDIESIQIVIAGVQKETFVL